MPFQNENTWYNAVSAGRESEFHAAYEEALGKVRKKLGKNQRNQIAGEPAAPGGSTFEKRSPGDTRVLIGRFQNGTRADTERAIASAKECFATWSATPLKDRAAIMKRAAARMARRKYEFAALCTLENGKNRTEAMGDVDEAIDFMRYYAQCLQKGKGWETPLGKAYPDEEGRSVMRPYGVFAVIAPFNFPVAITTGMLTGALITGNTAVLKPSSEAPLTGLWIRDVFVKSGVPAAAIQYVCGPGSEVGAALVESPHIGGIVFTGSKPVGIGAFKRALDVGAKPVIAEMGGKNAVIVTARASLDKAAEGVFRAAFGFSGQKCSACSRVFVDASVKAAFLAKLLEKVNGIRVGDPTERDVFMGPVIHEKAFREYEEAVALARRDGKVLAGGATLRQGPLADGWYVAPTVVDGLPPDHELMKRELFLPIVCVEAVNGLEAAIARANAAEYGLTAGIFSEDPAEVERFFERIEAGVCYANRSRGGSTGAMVFAQSFGGWKNSGTTGRGAGGPWYLLQFLREQSRTVVR